MDGRGRESRFEEEATMRDQWASQPEMIKEEEVLGQGERRFDIGGTVAHDRIRRHDEPPHEELSAHRGDDGHGDDGTEANWLRGETGLVFKYLTVSGEQVPWTVEEVREELRSRQLAIARCYETRMQRWGSTLGLILGSVAAVKRRRVAPLIGTTVVGGLVDITYCVTYSCNATMNSYRDFQMALKLFDKTHGGIYRALQENLEAEQETLSGGNK